MAKKERNDGQIFSLVLWAIIPLRALPLNPRVSSSLWVKAMVHIEVMIPSTRLALISELFDSHDRIYDMGALEERRHTQRKMLILPEAD